MSSSSQSLHAVKTDRLADDLWDLVSVPSPTGKERAAALLFAEKLKSCGADVELDERWPESPCVIGRVKGNAPGPALQLAGHIDHIDVSHRPPGRTATTISGRGASDMKAGLAVILEIVRALGEGGNSFPGELLVTVYGHHEAPVGDSRCLLHLLERGIKGDAALVVENSHEARDLLVLKGKGQSVWTLNLRWRGEPCHELNRPAEADGLLSAGMLAARALRGRNDSLAKAGADPFLGPESIYIGQMHCGDFYNRVATTCSLQGTWRWGRDRSFEDVKCDMDRLVRGLSLPMGIEANVDWTFVGEAYEVDGAEPIAKAHAEAFESVRGGQPEPCGISAVTDAARLVAVGGVPTVLCESENGTAHADLEVVDLERLRDACVLALKTSMIYLGTETSG